MKENKELERSDLAIDNDMEVDCDIGQQITCYIETRFDVDAKFGTHTDDGTWLNMYGKYNPYEDTLLVECEVCHDRDPSEHFDYTPTPSEAQLIKDMIAEKIRQLYKQTPKEFCESATRQDSEEVYAYQNRGFRSEKRLVEKWKQLREYAKEHGYEIGGSTSVTLPLSWYSEGYRDMISYCQSHGITKLLTDSYRDLAPTSAEAEALCRQLKADGMTVEFTDSRYAYIWEDCKDDAPQDQTPPEEETGEGITMGGM